MRKASIPLRNHVKKDAIVHPSSRFRGVLAVSVTLLLSAGMPIPIAYAQQESTLITVGGIGSPGTITPVAGTGQAGFSGDNGPATLGTLLLPHRVSLDRMGNLFIPDLFNHRVRKVDPKGIITTVAGNGPAGVLTPAGDLSGDSGLATESHLKKPQAAVFDAAGNMFILDSANNRVRRVDSSTGIISTVVGNGPLGDGNGGFFGDGGSASLAWLNRPAGLAMDAAGSLYVADVGNFRVRRVSPGTDGFITGAPDEIITTVAGNGTNASSGEGGPATQAGLTDPHGPVFDLAGNLYIADFNAHVVRKISPGADGLITGASDEIITTIAGNGTPGFSGDNGPATAAQLDHPHGLAVDVTDNLFIADAFNHRVRKVDPNGTITTVVGNGDLVFSEDQAGGSATAAGLRGPLDVAVDAIGNLFIADTGFFAQRVQQDGLGDGERAFKVFEVAAPGLLNGRLFPVTFASLCALTEGFVSQTGIANALCAKLSAAAHGSSQDRAGAINAYINQLSAQSGKTLSAAHAATLRVLVGNLAEAQ